MKIGGEFPQNFLSLYSAKFGHQIFHQPQVWQLPGGWTCNIHKSSPPQKQSEPTYQAYFELRQPQEAFCPKGVNWSGGINVFFFLVAAEYKRMFFVMMGLST